MKYIITIIALTVGLNAQIIQTQQLFNKKVVSVEEKNISIQKTFYGKTSIDESKIVDINTRFDGFIYNLYANKAFMYVDKKKPLFSIYSDEVVSVQEELHLAKKLKNNNTMYKSALNKLKVLDLHEKTLNELKNSSSIIENINVYSPINGYLIKKNVNDKGFVKKGNLILQVADFSKLWLIAQVYQNDIEFIHKGMKANIKLEGVNSSIKGVVDYIYPTIDSQKQTIDIRIIIDNSDLKLYPNMFAKVDLQKTTKTMLTLPRSAVLTKGNKHFVFKPLTDRDFEPVEVVASRVNSKIFEIKSGLNKGDKVIDKVLFMLDSDAVTNGLYDSDEDDDW